MIGINYLTFSAISHRMSDNKLIRVLGKRGAVEILENLDRKKEGMKYMEIEVIIGNPSTTSRRLADLERLGIIKRKVSEEKYRPVYYSLTNKGKSLVSIIRELKEKYRC